MLKQKWTLILLLFVVGACFAQERHPVKKPYYDTFNNKSINPNKWVATFPQTWGSPLEIVREVKNGQLRLGVRNTGRTDSDSGWEWAQNELYFVNPDHITSITTSMATRIASATQCPANLDPPSGVQVEFGGQFFNLGTGDPAQDVSALVVAGSESGNPGVLGIGLWWGSGDGTVGQYVGIGEYQVGQPLTGYLKWDQANHQFIGSITASGVETKVFAPYTVPDTAPVASPSKFLAVELATQNCTGQRTFSHGEAFFDNVMVNQ